MLAGKIAIVTGGARGIGAGIARALAAQGARVAVLDLDVREAEKTAAALPVPGMAIACDVAVEADTVNAVQGVIDELGGLDIVVNNAGVEITSLVVDLDPADITKMLNINILGTALGTKHAFLAMRPGGVAGSGGVVINVASVSATIEFPAISIYSATKSAVDRFTRVAAMESGKLGYGVRVNSIYPGLVPTEMGAGLAADVAQIGLFGSPDEAVAAVIDLTPSGRLGTVEDMADAVVFLASDQAKFINGVGLPVDGGMGM